MSHFYVSHAYQGCYLFEDNHSNIVKYYYNLK